MIFITCLAMLLLLSMGILWCLFKDQKWHFKTKALILTLGIVFFASMALYVGDLKTLYVAYLGQANEYAVLQAEQLQALYESEPDNESLAMAYFSAVSHGQNGNLTEAQTQTILKHWWTHPNPIYLNLLAVNAFQKKDYAQSIAIWSHLKETYSEKNTPIDIALTKAKALLPTEKPKAKNTHFVFAVPKKADASAGQFIVAVRSVKTPEIPVAVLKKPVSAEQKEIHFSLKALHSMQGKAVRLKGLNILKYQFLKQDQQIGDEALEEGWMVLE